MAVSHASSGEAKPLTEQQRRAVDTRGDSVVLSSGAGCGKTHVLTERYLAHLREDRAEVGQVVAITFTERAAREMRGRIRQAVEKRLRDADGSDAETWARHLRNLETASIGTIHAFCAALLRQNAVEAEVDPRFDVLEEVLSVNIEGEALDACLQRLLTAQTEAGEALRELVLLYGWRPVVDGVGALVRERDESSWDEWLGRPAQAVAAEWRDFARRSLRPRHVAHLLTTRPRVSHCLGLLRRYPPSPGPMAANVDRLLDEFVRLAEAPDLAAAVTELRESAKVGALGRKAWPDAAVYGPIRDALKGLRDEVDGWDLACYGAAPEGLAAAVEVGRRWLRVAREAAATYRERKRAHGVVDFQDLLTASRDLLRDHVEVRARLQGRYRFVLIDELQDTDPVQMELASLLCGAGLTAGKLFAVGDANQSIYRFRGADVHGFRRLRERMAPDGRQGLSRNYRSQPAILHFANALFRRCLDEYADLDAHHPQANPGPCVEFLWSPRGETASAAEARTAEADWIARRIAALVRGGEGVVLEGAGLRPARAGDVVLLFRAMSNVHLYEQALRRHGLDYYLVGGRAFFAQQEIYDLLSLLRALENPQDGVSLAGVLRSPFCCVSDEGLFVLGLHEGGLWRGLCDEAADGRLPADQRDRVARARRNLLRWRGLKDRLPIARLLGAVFADSGYDAATQFEPLGDRKLANLWKLQDLARTFDRSGLFGLAEFIARLGDLVRTQPREEQAATLPESADVVRLMTIHQAKGLEFPVVIVPDTAATGHGGPQPAARWDRGLGCVARPPVEDGEAVFPEHGWKLFQAQERLEEWQEDLRTLYVACTRARDFLILSAALPEPYRPEGPWMQTLAERFDLKTGRCLAADVAEGRRPAVRVYDRDAPPAAGEPRPSRPCASAASRLTQPWHTEGRRAAFVDLAPTATPPVMALAPPPAGERVLREALAAWDFRDPDGWRPAAVNGTSELEALLQRFAQSETRRQLAGARACLHEADFIVNLARAGAGSGAPTVRGVIDCLWQDGEGRWRLLFFTSTATKDHERAWKERLPALIAAAAAVREPTGKWPAGIALHFLADGGVVERAPARLPHRRILAEAAARLGENQPRP